MTSATVHVIGALVVDSGIDATGYVSSFVRMTAPSFTGSLSGTASYSNKSLSASYAPGSSAATYTSSLFGTASWATNAQLATQVTINGEANPDTYYVAIVNGSNVEYDNSGLFYYDLSPETLHVPHIIATDITATSITAGTNATLTNNQLSFTDTGASLTNNGLSFPGGGFIMLYGGGVTGSLLGTASYAKKALSASYAPGGSAATYTSSLFGTASWATNVVNGGGSTISASWASSSLSSSVESVITSAFSTGALNIVMVTGNGNGQQLYVMPSSTQLSYDIVSNVLITTASYANKALSASYSPGNSAATYTSSLFGTASWSNNSLVTNQVNVIGETNIDDYYVAFLNGSSVEYDNAGTFKYNPNLGLSVNSITTTNVSATSVTASLKGTASYANKALSSSYAPGSSAATYTSSLFGTSSWAVNVVNGGSNSTSASWASSSLSASYLTTTNNYTVNGLTASYISASKSIVVQVLTASIYYNYTPYNTVLTSSTQWITCSFSNPNQVVNLTISGTYSFTSSNMPSTGNSADVIVFLNNSAVASSSLSFPSNWIPIHDPWPTTILASKSAVLWLRGYDVGTVIGTYNQQP